MRQGLDSSLQTTLEFWQDSASPNACGDLLLTANGPDAVRILLADASGHGPSAARIAQRFASIAREDLSRPLTANVFRKWNAILAEELDESAFIAVTAIEIEHVGGRIGIWNAGNPAPLWLRSDTRQITSLEKYGALLGLFEPASYEPPTRQEIRPESDDAVLVFSDGLTDQCNGERYFGDRLLMEAINAAVVAGDNPLARIESSLAAFCRDVRPVDDVTVVQLSCKRSLSRVQAAAQPTAA